MSDWFDNDDIWRIFGDCMFDDDRFTAAKDEIEQLLALVVDPPTTILDLGCGPGRHALPLARAGYQVTALDLSPTLLDRARAREGELQPNSPHPIDWVHADMRQFSAPSKFDLILSMWTSFGYFDDPADDLRVLEQCYNNLRPGGQLLIDVAGKETICRNIQPVHLTEYDNGDLLIERPVLEHNMTRYSNQWLLLRDGRYHEAHWHHNLYSGQELTDRLRSMGFANVRLCGDLQGADYDLDAERMIAIAERPANPR